MKEFKQHQKNAISAKMHDLSRTIFVSYDDGGTWFAKGDTGKSVYSMDRFISFDTSVLYVAVSKENLEAATACLVDNKIVEATYAEDVMLVSKRNIFEKQEHWLAFSEGLVELCVKKEPLIMWVAATNEWCSKPHNSAHELAKKLSLDHDGEITDGQTVGVFTFNMIKVEL